MAEENKGLGVAEEPATPTPKLPATPKAGHGTPKAGTPAARPPVVATGSPGTPLRSPQMIQFGKFDITTWYSSPYPQVSSICPPVGVLFKILPKSFLFILEKQL